MKSQWQYRINIILLFVIFQESHLKIKLYRISQILSQFSRILSQILLDAQVCHLDTSAAKGITVLQIIHCPIDLGVVIWTNIVNI